MLHLRVIAPVACSEQVAELLSAEPGVTNLIVLPGAARQPPGDVLLCDVAREAGNHVLGRLRGLGLERDGSIAVEYVDTALSRAARDAERAAPGHGSDAVVWEEIEARTSEESTLSWSYLAFLAIATVIAAIGVVTDQLILIVGAMVVGPEFGPLAGMCVALVQRRRRELVRSGQALLVGFAVAIAATVLLSLLARVTGLIDPAMLDRTNPLTGFISHPDTFSFVVAFLAGAAGMLSLTTAKSGALIGVLISVTTVPAAGNAAVALALSHETTAGGAVLQLLVNLAGIVLAGVLTLCVQRWAWSGRRKASTVDRT